ncbi:MAG: hypothetical protein HKP58_15045, partial [Desulfatitalea sp.]|nr:Hpt domain-containing protein [Desulfatitalea sp.]NNK01725.1 hypothetical protein [Desulfatitalea sp.]
MNENALLQDFIVETGEHLMAAERNVLNLAQQFEDTGMLNEIFRCIHTIKGSSEYLGLARIAELSHKLENLLDLLRRGECKVEAEVIDLLISANDRIAELVDDLSQNQQEQACIEDLVSRIDTYTKNAVLMSATEAVPQPTDTHEGVGIEDEYDEKLFDIFMDQLVDGLQVLIQESLKMPPSMDDEDPFLRYRDRLGTLRASAIYMGYD